ncbi:MAG: hypothetical protein MRY63_02375 [Neomegalonema sp.]|nr:hypothetical protein [Neomegalonema sp.]
MSERASLESTILKSSKSNAMETAMLRFQQALERLSSATGRIENQPSSPPDLAAQAALKDELAALSAQRDQLRADLDALRAERERQESRDQESREQESRDIGALYRLDAAVLALRETFGDAKAQEILDAAAARTEPWIPTEAEE